MIATGTPQKPNGRPQAKDTPQRIGALLDKIVRGDIEEISEGDDARYSLASRLHGELTLVSGIRSSGMSETVAAFENEAA